MAQKVQVLLTDDLDGKDADETVLFGLDGVSYEIDLSTKNAKGLRDALAKYVAVSRKVGTKSAGRPGRGKTPRTGPEPKAVREWAAGQNIDVPSRGRIPAEVIEQYEAAHK
jgi:hypothetical protein